MKYTRVIECKAAGDGVSVQMLGEDEQVHRFDVSAACAGLLVAELAAEFGKLDARDNGQQFIRPTGMQTGKSDKGEPILFLTLDGGAELPLVFKPESMTMLIGELQRLMQSAQPEPQIRWR